MTRATALVVGACLVSLALVGAYLAAGGAEYAPVRPQDPCDERPWRDPESLQQIAEQFSLSALDGAACKLGVSREALARALATPQARERFARRFGIDDERLAEAIRAGLVRAVDDAERAGALPPLVAGPLRDVVREVPLDRAIELVRDARSLLGGLGGLFGPAGELLGPAGEFLGPAGDLLEGLLR